MKRKIFAVMCMTILMILFVKNVSAEEYDNGTFCLTYDENEFSVEITDGGTVKIKAFDMPSDNGGHNTVLGCLSELNPDYIETISEEDLRNFQNTFTYDLCTGLFEVDNGISVIADGYTYFDEKCEYYRVLSDGTECYITMYNYGETVYYSVCRLCPYTSELNDGYRSIYRSIKLSDEDIEDQNELGVDFEEMYGELLIEYEDLKQKYDNMEKKEAEAADNDEWKLKYDELSQKYEELNSAHDALTVEYEALRGEQEEKDDSKTENLKETEGDLPAEEEYADMLIKYGDIFTNELSVLSNQKGSDLIKENGDVSDLLIEIALNLSKLAAAEENLQKYYDQFDANRKEMPMGTPIMTLLSHAQSAVRQYTIALQHLQDFFSNQQQQYIDDFVEYSGKAADSLDEFNTLLKSEKASLGLE